MGLCVKAEIVCGAAEDVRVAAGLKDGFVFDSVDLSDIHVPDHLHFRDREFEYDCNAFGTHMKAKRLSDFALQLEQNPVIHSLCARLKDSGHRILIATAPVNPCVTRRWPEATFTNLELTEHGFRVRDGRFVLDGDVIVRQYVEYDHLLERLISSRHLTTYDMVAFANAGVTKEHLLLNLKAQLFDVLPTEDFIVAFRDIPVDG